MCFCALHRFVRDGGNLANYSRHNDSILRSLQPYLMDTNFTGVSVSVHTPTSHPHTHTPSYTHRVVCYSMRMGQGFLMIPLSSSIVTVLLSTTVERQVN